jgi:hypothetical protein
MGENTVLTKENKVPTKKKKVLTEEDTVQMQGNKVLTNDIVHKESVVHW